MASLDVLGVWVMEEEDTALGGEKWGERKGKEKKKKKRIPTTLDDLQRLIAELFLGLGQALACTETLVLAAPGLSFPGHRHLHCNGPAATALPITLPVQLTTKESKWPSLPLLGDAAQVS